VTKRPLINYFPKKLNSQYSFIVTIRSRIFRKDLINGKPCIEILPFAPQKIRILLQLKAVRMADGQGELDMKRLLEILGYISLTIIQTAAFMRRNRMHLQKYVETFEKDEENFKNHLSIEFRDYRKELDISNSIFQIWKLSFN
jgi:hypothetical protein